MDRRVFIGTAAALAASPLLSEHAPALSDNTGPGQIYCEDVVGGNTLLVDWLQWIEGAPALARVKPNDGDWQVVEIPAKRVGEKTHFDFGEFIPQAVLVFDRAPLA